MRERDYYVRRAGDMYRTARSMAEVLKSPYADTERRARAELLCRRAVELAGMFEELALIKETT